MKLTPAEAKLLYAVAVKRGNTYLAEELEHRDEVVEYRYRMVCNDLEGLIAQERKDPENLGLIREQTKLLDKFKRAEAIKTASE
jgi:hypothetical protein